MNTWTNEHMFSRCIVLWSFKNVPGRTLACWIMFYIVFWWTNSSFSLDHPQIDQSVSGGSWSCSRPGCCFRHQATAALAFSVVVPILITDFNCSPRMSLWKRASVKRLTVGLMLSIVHIVCFIDEASVIKPETRGTKVPAKNSILDRTENKQRFMYY